MFLKCDILLVADVFKKIRNNSLKNYWFCQSHYLNVPGLIWDATLKIAKIKLEIISDPDVYVFFKKGARGKISYICNKCSKVNSKQEWKHAIYLDASDIYVYAMSKFLPISGFKWIGPKQFELNNYTRNSSKECVLEIDLENPRELR